MKPQIRRPGKGKAVELRFEGLTKSYKTKYALKDFTVTLTEGVYGILGPNGAGKSTLMNLLTDNVRRTSGSIYFNGEEILKLGAAFRREIGYMPQQQGMYDEFSANRFLQYIAGLKGLPRKRAAEEIRELLELVGLADSSHRRLGTFSGGMRQRVLLAQALLGNPSVLVLDEPTTGLDPEERIRIRNYISEISANKIVLLATHVVSDIEGISSEVLLMKQGTLLKKASPAALIAGISGRVGEGAVTREGLVALQKQYKIGNIFHCKDGLRLRLVADKLPEGFSPVEDHIGLEDVYLYYLEKL